MKIVVGGYIVSFPLGGMTWHHLHYVLGLHELGHEVWFYEFGSWPPYNPLKQYCEPDAAYGLSYLKRQFELFDLPPRWCYHAPWCGWHNMSQDDADQVLGSADLLICVSGVTPLHQIRRRPKRTLVIDTDPVFTQLRMREDQELRDYYDQFDAVATFGRLIGTSACDIPTHRKQWIGTHQPIVLKHWPVVPCESPKRLSTIGKWEHNGRHVDWQDRRFFSSKGIEWLKMIDIPKRTSWEMSIGMQSMPCLGREHFEAQGWRWIDPEQASADCNAFRGFVQNSAGEFTVVKNLYAGVKSGWFSDRSACYLASGRPVVAQSSGFEQWLPAGEGVLPFDTPDEAASALEELQAHYARHSLSARRIAEEHFDSRRVLSDLLDAVI